MANQQNSTANKLTRHDFPPDFLFGAATSAYQVEGGYADGGKSLSNWDTFSMQKPSKIADGTNGSVAVDHYHRFKEDVALMKKLGLDAYRFSLSWSRILPGGRLSAGVNREGVRFYNDLINALLSEGIEPFVTIIHFDFPQCLLDEYGGFADPRIVQDFAEYADVCFFEFGDRVKHWITVNEPWTMVHNGYIVGSYPPAHGSFSEQTDAQSLVRHRCSSRVDRTCYGGDPTTEPYIVAHHVILAHAAAIDIYRKNYQAVQGGKIGITNMTTWYEPYDSTPENIAAAERALDFMWGWFSAPIVTGDYPPVMRERVGDRLPKFTQEETTLIKGSYDFIGTNYYTAMWASNNPNPGNEIPPGYYRDMGVRVTFERNGELIGEQNTGSEWLHSYPQGILKLTRYIKDKYNDPVIYITENGSSEKNDVKLSITEALKDDFRVRYHQDHLAYLRQAIDDYGVKVKGYMLWSLIDNYEWAEGYESRFGLYYVDFVTTLNRYPKDSAIWYMNFLNRNIRPAPKRIETTKEDNTVKRKRIRN